MSNTLITSLSTVTIELPNGEQTELPAPSMQEAAEWLRRLMAIDSGDLAALIIVAETFPAYTGHPEAFSGCMPMDVAACATRFFLGRSRRRESAPPAADPVNTS